ncbi:MAG: signal peptidase II [Bacteriovoracaceae bacterium]|nr:signal peptidase II [Bacteriovoracaceae bacterium]
MARFWKLLVMICFLIIIDQITKGWTQSYFKFEGETLAVIQGFFSLTYVKNPGAAFGFGGQASPLARQIMFLAVPTLFSIWVVVMLFKSLKGPFHMSLAYALILAGAVGNLIDRFSLGYVVDFFLFYYKEHDFPAFNVADSCITIAAFLLIWDVFWQYKNKKKIQAESQA